MASVEVITDDIVEVRVVVAGNQRSSNSYSAGQYIFMNVPCISALQWHPFSITSAPREGNIVVFHVKALGGPSSWTSSLLAAAKQSANGTLGVKLDGFFGHNAVHALVKPRTAVVLVGGGVGVTPLLSILADLSERGANTRVFLVWCTRTSKEFLAFAPRIAAAKARLGDRLHACIAITRFDTSKPQQSGAVCNVNETVSTLANDARTIPPWRYGLRDNEIVEIDENYHEMKPPATPGSLVRVVPSMVWFGLICCASIVLMTIVYAEVELLEEKMLLDMESTRILALLLPVLVVAALCVLCSTASQHCAVLWQNADSAYFGGSNENSTPRALSALIPELLDDRIGKRVPLSLFFDEVAATLARDRSVVEVKVVACGANAQVAEARMQCERLNRAVATEGCLWSFQEESWDW